MLLQCTLSSDKEHTELGVVAFVQESLGTNTLNNNVPRVDRTRGSHEGGEDGICGKDSSSVLHGQLTDDRIISSGDLNQKLMDELLR